MSTESIVARARAEADEAEREDEDTTEPGEPDNGSEDEPVEEIEEDELPVPEPPSDAQIEETSSKIQTKAANYTKAQLALLAETGIPWAECPTCQVAGFVAPFDPNDPSEYDRKANTDAYFGATEPSYLTAEDAETCPKCDGWGQVLSGARNPTNRLKVCGNCGALGWVTKVQPATTLAPGQMPTPGYQPQGVTPEGVTQPDIWGRPPGHRDYGVPPALVGA